LFKANYLFATHLFDVLKQIYDKDEYVLINGDKKASTMSTTKNLCGVKQGCPLSPLFFLFINSKVPDFYYDGKKLDNKDSFIHLGVIFDRHMNLDTAASQAAKSFRAAMHRVKELGLENKVVDRPHIMLWLFKTYAISVGTYGSQVWSTHYLHPNKNFQNILQVKHMKFLKRLLRLKGDTGNWTVLKERA